MSGAVVDRLEGVEVEQRNAELAAVALAAVDLAGGALVELAVVEQVGERVAARELLLRLEQARVRERDRTLVGVGLEPLDVARQEVLLRVRERDQRAQGLPAE